MAYRAKFRGVWFEADDPDSLKRMLEQLGAWRQEDAEASVELAELHRAIGVLVAAGSVGSASADIAKKLGMRSGHAISGRIVTWTKVINDLGLEKEDVLVPIRGTAGERRWMAGPKADHALALLEKKLATDASD